MNISSSSFTQQAKLQSGTYRINLHENLPCSRVYRTGDARFRMETLRTRVNDAGFARILAHSSWQQKPENSVSLAAGLEILKAAFFHDDIMTMMKKERKATFISES